MTVAILAGTVAPLSKKWDCRPGRAISGVCMLAMLLPACAPRMHYRELPRVPLAEKPLRTPLGLPLVLDAVRLFGADGEELQPAPWLINWIVQRWRASGLFEHVYGPAEAEIAPISSARGRLVVREMVGGDEFFNAIKVMLATSTVFLTSAILPLHFDLEQTMECEVDLPGGEALRYEVNTAARQMVYPPRLGSAIARYADVTAVNVAALAQHMRAEPRLRPWEVSAPGRRAPFLQSR